MALPELTEATLPQLLTENPATPSGWIPSAGHPAVIKFYVPWCQPCKALDPVFAEAATTCGDRIDFRAVDIDRERRLAVRFRVRNVPAVALIKANGAVSMLYPPIDPLRLRTALEEFANGQ